MERAIFEEKREWWETNGKHLKIWELNPQFFDKNPHPVIHFDFSQAPDNEAFTDIIRGALNDVSSTYNLEVNHIEENVQLKKLIYVKFKDILRSLLRMQNKNKPNGVVITIDESDQPLLNQMFNDQLPKKQQEDAMNITLNSLNLFYGLPQSQTCFW